MHGDAQRVADHLVVGVDVGGAEVDDDVDDEHDVHDEVHHVERAAGVAAVLHGDLPFTVEQEGGGVRREDGRVDHQQQDQPVPHRLERAVVQHCPLVDARRLELVLRQNVSAQWQHLQGRQRPERLLKQEVFPKTVRWIANQKNAKDGEEIYAVRVFFFTSIWYYLAIISIFLLI